MAAPRLTRRTFVGGSLAVPLALALGSCEDGGEGGTERAPRSSAAPEPRALEPTPACDDGDGATLEQTEGPYFTPGSPRRRRLREAGVMGAPLLLTGRVLDTRCRPIEDAMLDFWQADGRGEYHTEGQRLRGHQLSGSGGRFRLETVVPGLYPGRTRHIHVKVQPRGGEVLTTQLYFRGDPGNADDAIFDERLEMAVASARGRARFDFALPA